MTRINWLRLIIGGLIVSVICFLTDGFFHERVVATDWSAVYRALGVAEPHHDATGLIYFAIFELGRGFAAIVVYVLMRAILPTWPKNGGASRRGYLARVFGDRPRAICAARLLFPTALDQGGRIPVSNHTDWRTRWSSTLQRCLAELPAGEDERPVNYPAFERSTARAVALVASACLTDVRLAGVLFGRGEPAIFANKSSY